MLWKNGKSKWSFMFAILTHFIFPDFSKAVPGKLTGFQIMLSLCLLYRAHASSVRIIQDSSLDTYVCIFSNIIFFAVLNNYWHWMTTSTLLTMMTWNHPSMLNYPTPTTTIYTWTITCQRITWVRPVRMKNRHPCWIVEPGFRRQWLLRLPMTLLTCPQNLMLPSELCPKTAWPSRQPPCQPQLSDKCSNNSNLLDKKTIYASLKRLMMKIWLHPQWRANPTWVPKLLKFSFEKTQCNYFFFSNDELMINSFSAVCKTLCQNCTIFLSPIYFI